MSSVGANIVCLHYDMEVPMGRKQKIWIYIAVVGIAAALLLKTVWWPMDKVIHQAAFITEALVVEPQNANPNGRQAYADEETVAELAELLGDMKLQFDRKSDTFTYEPDVPAYHLMLSGEDFSYGVIFVSGTKLHYNNTTFMMTEEDAAALNDVLASCFS